LSLHEALYGVKNISRETVRGSVGEKISEFGFAVQIEFLI